MTLITGQWLDSSAKQAALQSKLLAFHRGILTFSANGGSAVVTTEVEAAALTDTPVTALTAKGVYVGAVSGANDAKKVLIRAAGTDNGIDDGNNDEVYGVLTEDTGVFTLTFKKADGTAFSFGVATDIDFYFVEVGDLDDVPAEFVIQRSVTGVVDASQASTLAGHLNGGASKHDATEIDFELVDGSKKVIQASSDTVEAALVDLDASLGGHLDGAASKHDATEIDYERVDGSKKNIQAASDDIESAITDLDDAIGALAASPTNYTPVDASIVADHLAAIDVQLASAAGTVFSDADFKLQNEAAPTKEMSFDLSGITAGNNRVVTAADRAVSLDNVTQEISQEITLVAGDITNKYVDLSNVPKVPAAVKLFPVGGPMQNYGVDFTIITDGSVIKRLNWNGLGLDGVLIAGNKLRVVYSING